MTTDMILKFSNFLLYSTMVHALEFHWKPVSYTTYSIKYSKYMDNKTKEMVTIC